VEFKKSKECDRWEISKVFGLEIWRRGCRHISRSQIGVIQENPFDLHQITPLGSAATSEREKNRVGGQYKVGVVNAVPVNWDAHNDVVL